MGDENWKQAITLILFDEEGGTAFRADVPVTVVEEDGQSLITFPPEVLEVGADGVATAEIRMKHSNRAGRAMARAGIPPEPAPPALEDPEEEPPDDRDFHERRADEEAEDADRRLDAEKLGDL
jgi:hypothetical protein